MLKHLEKKLYRRALDSQPYTRKSSSLLGKKKWTDAENWWKLKKYFKPKVKLKKYLQFTLRYRRIQYTRNRNKIKIKKKKKFLYQHAAPIETTPDGFFWYYDPVPVQVYTSLIFALCHQGRAVCITHEKDKQAIRHYSYSSPDIYQH